METFLKQGGCYVGSSPEDIMFIPHSVRVLCWRLKGYIMLDIKGHYVLPQ